MVLDATLLNQYAGPLAEQLMKKGGAGRSNPVRHLIASLL